MLMERAHWVQHLKWASFELLLDLRSLHLFRTSFTLEVGLMNGQSADLHSTHFSSWPSLHLTHWKVWSRCPNRLGVFLRSKDLLCTSRCYSYNIKRFIWSVVTFGWSAHFPLTWVWTLFIWSVGWLSSEYCLGENAWKNGQTLTSHIKNSWFTV